MKIWPILVAVAVLLAPAVTKACTLPAGVEGQFLFNHDYNLVQYCDANNVWVRLGGSTTDARIGTLTANKWCAANAGGTGLDCTQNAPTAGITALTGDVTASGSGSVAATIAANAVTYAKIQNTSAASVLLGRGSASGAGAVQELTLGSGLSLSGTTLSASASGTVSGTTNYVAKFTSATAVGNSQIFDNGTNVGIGTTSPGMLFDVNGAARVGNGTNFATNDGGLLLYSNNAYKIGFDSNGAAPYAIRYNVDVADSSHGHVFSAGPISSPTNLMTVRGDGKVGIGTASPTYKVDVSGPTSGSGSDIGLARISTSDPFDCLLMHNTSAAGHKWSLCSAGTSSTLDGQFYIFDSTAGAMRFNIGATGNVGIGTAVPQAKLDVTGSIATGTVGTETELSLTRPINSGVSFPQIAAFKVGTYNATYPGPFTRLDFNLKSVADNTLTADANIMTLLSSGNVGIGTATPKMLLDVNGVMTAPGLIMNGYFDGAWRPKTAGYLGYIQMDASTGKMYFWNSTASVAADTAATLAARMTLDKDGNVGIGTTSPAQKLNVNGYVQLDGQPNWATGNYVCIYNGVLNYGSSCSGSDVRLKKNIVPLKDVLADILALNPIRFEYKDSGRGTGPQLGLIAQDVEKSFPELVSKGKDDFLSLDYSHLTAVLVEGVKELNINSNNLRAALQAESDKQEVEIRELREEIKALKASIH